NWVHHCTFYRWAYDGYADHRGGLLDLGRALTAGDESDYNLIEHNIFAYGGHHTLGNYSKFNVIRYNYFHNETNPAQWDFEGYRGSITEGPSAGRCLYEGNRYGWSLASGLSLRSSNNILRHNHFYHQGSAGLQVVASSDNDTADGNRIYHNVFYNNGHEIEYTGFQCGVYFSNWNGIDPVDNIVQNNIFYQNATGSVCYDGTFDRPALITNWDAQDTDPGFVDLSGADPNDATLPDFTLAQDNAAKDKGSFLTTIASPSGTGETFAVVDAGFFMDGWGVIEGDLIQLANQSVQARITHVDYQTNTLTVDTSLTFETGQGVSLAYGGAAPDQGAAEVGAP
ncbi:MAG: right-handed parallel beta-helix repeat-containing protein, partial [Anaerolineae bacterium]